MAHWLLLSLEFHPASVQLAEAKSLVLIEFISIPPKILYLVLWTFTLNSKLKTLIPLSYRSVQISKHWLCAPLRWNLLIWYFPWFEMLGFHLAFLFYAFSSVLFSLLIYCVVFLSTWVVLDRLQGQYYRFYYLPCLDWLRFVEQGNLKESLDSYLCLRKWDSLNL